ncbi:MAG: alkaline phosphatase family protein [Anaerolineae bacterium]
MTTLLILIDGLRPDALAQADAPAMNGLRRRGAWTLQARSVMPNITLVCHMSIFHSVPPSRHGITQNLYQPLARPLPGLFERVKEAGLKAAFFYNWETLRDLGRPGSLHFSYFHDSSYDLANGDRQVAQEAVCYIEREKPDFVFLYLGSTDVRGHACGWMSEEYLAHVTHIDRLIGDVLDGLPPGSTVLLQSDHGGHERMHGTDIPEDMLIPWIVTGPNIRRDYEIQQPVSLLNTAPTITAVLGIDSVPAWEGACVDEIFEAG